MKSKQFPLGVLACCVVSACGAGTGDSEGPADGVQSASGGSDNGTPLGGSSGLAAGGLAAGGLAAGGLAAGGLAAGGLDAGGLDAGGLAAGGLAAGGLAAGGGGQAGSSTSGTGGGSGSCAPNRLVPTLDPALTFSGPITITKGGTYSGNWRSNKLGENVVTINTTEDVTIENAVIAGYGNLIYGAKVGRIVVNNTRGFGLARTRAGQSPGKFVHLRNPKDARISNNYFEYVWGIRIDGFVGASATGDSIKVLRNRARNVDGDTKAHLVQYVNVYNITGSEIGWNENLNLPNESHVEDVINIFDSSGTAASPIRIHDNYIHGAYPPDAATGKYSGGGILLGDGGFNSPPLSSVSAWVVADHNQVIATTNYGIAIAAGHDNHFTDNRVIASGLLADGSYITAQNVGLYVWDIRANPSNFFNNWGANNVVGWAKKNAGGTLVQNNFFFPGCASGMCTGNKTYDSQPTRAMEAQEEDLWDGKMLASCVKVGYSP